MSDFVDHPGRRARVTVHTGVVGVGGDRAEVVALRQAGAIV